MRKARLAQQVDRQALQAQVVMARQDLQVQMERQAAKGHRDLQARQVLWDHRDLQGAKAIQAQVARQARVRTSVIPTTQTGYVAETLNPEPL